MVRDRKFTNHGCIPHKYPVPCKDCKDRKIGCHGACDKYRSWALKEKEYKEEIIKKQYEHPDYYAGRKKA